jgi:hypothetical protein
MAVLRSPAPVPTAPHGWLATAARWFDLRRLLILSILTILAIPAIQPMTDPDFFWHLATGIWILAHHAVPHQDLYTFTVSQHRWVTHEWLSEALMALLYQLGRLPLVNLTLGLVTVAGFLLVFAAIDRRVNFVIASLAMALGVAAGNPIWGPRIQMVTFALTALTLLWLQRFLTGKSRALYALPAVMAVWANLHAGFTAAYGFLAIALLVEGGKILARRDDAIPPPRWRRLALISLGALAAAVFNPNTVGIYPYALQTQGSAVQQKLIVEWFSPNFQLTSLWPFAAMLFLLIAGLALARRVEARAFCLALASLALTLHSVRMLPFFVITATPLLAGCWQQVWEQAGPRRRRRSTTPANALTLGLNSVVLLIVLLTVVLAVRPALTQRIDGKQIARDFPIQAANFLVQHPPPGRMLNQYGWGGYLVYRLSPGQRVFVFGDAALMGDRLLQDYADIVYLNPDQPRLLNQYGVNWIIFRSDDPLVTELGQVRSTASTTGWFELGSFGQATILMRDTPQNRAYAASAR